MSWVSSLAAKASHKDKILQMRSQEAVAKLRFSLTSLGFGRSGLLPFQKLNSLDSIGSSGPSK